MKKKISLSLIFLFIIAGSLVYYGYSNLEPSTNRTDIAIVSTIEPYDDEYYNYLVEMDIKRNNNDHSAHMVYLVIEGMQGISFTDEQGYYKPSSIGIGPSAEQLLRRTDKGEKELIGFGIPEEKGDYKSKFLLKTTGEISAIEDGAFYYIHIEKKLGKDLNWVEEYKIKL